MRPRIHEKAAIGGPPEDRTAPLEYHYPEVDPTASIEAFVSVDGGLDQPTRVGPRAWLLKHSHIGHDAQIGPDCLIATGAVIGGYAVIEDGAKVGLNATVLPYRTVGKGAEVGAGSVVTRDVPAGEVWAGNPARRLKGKNAVPYSERDADGLPKQGGYTYPRIGDRPATMAEVKQYIKQYG